MEPGARNRTSKALHRARRLRKDPSASQAIVWSRVRRRSLGFRFNREVPVGPYFLDFYCAEARLALEIDGGQHLDRAERDLARDEWLSQRGIATFRIPSLLLFEETGVEFNRRVADLVAILERRSGRKAFPNGPSASAS